MDTRRQQDRPRELAMVKVVVPRMTLGVLDRAIQRTAPPASATIFRWRDVGAHAHDSAGRRPDEVQSGGDRETGTEEGPMKINAGESHD